MTKTTIGRCGSSLAVRQPADIAASLNLQKGERIEMAPKVDHIITRQARPHDKVQDLFAARPGHEWGYRCPIDHQRRPGNVVAMIRLW